MKKIIFTLLAICAFVNVKAQEALTAEALLDSLQYRPLSDSFDYTKIELPHVQVFLDAAQSYAAVRFYDAKKREQELQFKISRKEWLKYIRLQGSYQYGNTSTLAIENSGVNDPNSQIYRTNTQSFYNAGVAISIPLDDLFSRKNKNDVARMRIDQSGYELEQSLEERQMIILESYNEVVKNLALLKINAESVALYNAQMRISEQDFATGNINIIDLSLERGRRSEANIKYQTSRAALHNAVTILEMLTKIKIIK